MKKKTIEKIPYLGLQKISRKKSAKYIGVTAIKIIGHKKHLLLEVYENKKESKKIPVVRITLTKKDFGTYWPDKNIWTRQYVSYYRPIWMETYTGGILTDENILQSPEDLERIKNFCGTKLFEASWWWEHISRYEADITSTERINRVERERKRRQEALKDRQANTKALPEKAILYRADHAYFHDEHFLYYKKHGSRADIACSKCGGVTTARWKSSGAYEDQFERNIEEPRENSFGTCPMCGARGQYKCKGKVKGSIRKTRYLFLGQKYKDNGFVMRYIQVHQKICHGGNSTRLCALSLMRMQQAPGHGRTILEEIMKYRKMSQQESILQQKLLSQRMTMQQLEKLALMRSKRLNREAWQIMSRLLEQEKSKRMIPPTEIQTAERIIESLQTGPRNRQEKRALESKLRRRKNPHKSLKNQSLRALKRKKMKPKA